MANFKQISKSEFPSGDERRNIFGDDDLKSSATELNKVFGKTKDSNWYIRFDDGIYAKISPLEDKGFYAISSAIYEPVGRVNSIVKKHRKEAKANK